MLKNLPILEIIKDEARKYQLHLPSEAQASEILQVLTEMFSFISNAIQNNMNAQAQKPPQAPQEENKIDPEKPKQE